MGKMWKTTPNVVVCYGGHAVNSGISVLKRKELRKPRDKRLYLRGRGSSRGDLQLLREAATF
jgi:hypothetical protein